MSHQGYYTNPSNLENINDALLDVEADANRAEAAANGALVSETNAANSAAQANATATSIIGYVNDAQAAAASAANSATSALGNATIAEGHADDAALSATNASNSAAQSALSAVDSANSAISSANSASAAASSAASINPDNFLLKADNLSGLANVSQSRTNLGLGTIATQNSNSVSITGGSVTGITDLAITDGGTGSSTASGARTNLGVYSTTEVDTLKASKSGDTFTGNVNVPSLNGGQLAGMRNKIINGKMEIAHRGVSISPLGVGAAYTLDRWIWVAAGTTAFATASRQADVPSDNEFQTSLRVTITTADASIAAGDLVYVDQRIEGFNARDLIGRTFTLSFRVRSSKTGTHCVFFSNSNGDRSFVVEYTVNAANTWEQKSITVAGGLITAGTWDWTNGIGLQVGWTLASGSTFNTTPGAWQTGVFRGTANQVNCLDTVGNIFAITGVQLEVGAVATPFEHRPVGLEFSLCQRYYQVVQERIVWCGYSVSTGVTMYATLPYQVPMRTTPTVSNVTNSGNSGFGATSVFPFATFASATALSTIVGGANLMTAGYHLNAEL